MAYVPAKNLTLTFNSITVKATDASIDRGLGEVDMTNTASSGNYEFVTDISDATMQFTAVVDSASVPNFAIGQSGTATFAMTGGRTTTGTATITRSSHKGGPRGAYTIAATVKYSGAVTES
jgi:hypothetical protein